MYNLEVRTFSSEAKFSAKLAGKSWNELATLLCCSFSCQRVRAQEGCELLALYQ
jgi:hypothetical protein